MDFNIPSDKTDIVVAVSPGTKAALLLYLLSKYVHENSVDVTIQPVCEVAIDYEYHTIQQCNSILSYVKNKFPSAKIEDVRYIRKLTDDPTIPRKALKDAAIEYQSENSVNAIIMTGTTKVLELSYLEKIEKYHGTTFDKIRYYIENAESLRHHSLGDWPIHYVFAEFTKAKIHEMYKTYDIEDLFDLTVSCDKHAGSECGTCFGCAERSYLENNV